MFYQAETINFLSGTVVKVYGGPVYLFGYLLKENVHIGIFSGLFYEIKICLHQEWI